MRLLVLLLLSFLLSLGLAAPSCPKGAFLSVYGDKCFHVEPIALDYPHAEKMCVGFGGHLASVHNKWDNAELIVAAGFAAFWLGAHDMDTDEWSWTDSSALNFTSWADGEPSRAAGNNCLLVDAKSHLWTAVVCTTKANFVCETNVQAAIPVPTTADKHTTIIFEPSSTSWEDAQKNCQKLQNGNLLSIPTKADQDSFVDHVPTQGMSTNAFWIGAKLDASGKPYWVDGSKWDYENWAPHMPNSAIGSCIAIVLDNKEWTWASWNCAQIVESVCKSEN